MSLTIDMYDAILSEQVFCQQKQNQHPHSSQTSLVHFK